ncbi:MAG: hypothetical protein ACLRJV_19725 [Eubacteriales bacterium]
MNRIQQIQYLIQVLLQEMPAYQEQARAFPQDELSQWRLLRSLMNVRPPMPLDPSFLAVQDDLLSAEREEKGVVEADAPGASRSSRYRPLAGGHHQAESRRHRGRRQ